MSPSIHADTKIGAVYLTISNMERSLDYYQNVIGLKLHRHEGDTAYLGAGGADLLVLTEVPDAPHLRGTTGLYHFAILVPSRLELARSLKRLSDTKTRIQGFADHLVSEAIYLGDPDGNGIEIYRDRPRTEWPRLNGQIQMASDPIDLDGIMAELQGHDEAWTGLHPDTVIGHVHVHVSNLEKARAFYVDVLGFDLIIILAGSAGFVSAGGYHHHVGFNTWAGVGAPPPPPNAVGLRYYVVELPNADEVDVVKKRIEDAGLPIETIPEGVLVRDPSQNGIVLAARKQG
jgi:catechol 2,3-dioxygenase